MYSWIFVLFLAVHGVLASAVDLSNCTVCASDDCGTATTDLCYLHCPFACPAGYSSANLSATNATCRPPTLVTTDDPREITTVVVLGVTDLTPPETAAAPQLACHKCAVANCSTCPPDDFQNNCTSCLEGFQLQLASGSEGNSESAGAAQQMKCVLSPDSTGGGDGTGAGGGGGGGGGGGQGENKDDGGGGGGSSNTAVVAGVVAAAGLVVLVVAAVVIVLLWRRRQANAGSDVMMTMVKQKQKPSQESDDEDRSDSRYTKSPVGTMRDPSSVGGETSEVHKLGWAPPPPPQENYDALDLQRQNSVQPYGQLQIKEDQDDLYGNSNVINQVKEQSRPYANSDVAAAVTTVDETREDEPSEIYGNDEVLQAQGRGQGPDQGQETAPEELYLNNEQVAMAHQGGLTQDDIYINDQAPTQDDVYLNDVQPADPENEVYLNQGAELVEENVYGNT